MAAVPGLKDPRRQEPAFVLDERQMLEGWLDFHRVTLELKCEGLSDEQRKSRPVATSKLSLHGLVRHMAEVERGWFRCVLLKDASAPAVFSEELDGDLEPLDGADWDADLAVWQDECQASRELSAPLALDDVGEEDGEPCSLRWIYTHMIEEYARNNGHADLIRELVGGSVGW
ncbi:MAG: DinB family protein [Acidimicrobiales bacterium]